MPSAKVVGRKQEAGRTMRKGRMSRGGRAIQETDPHGGQRKGPVGRGRGSRGCPGGAVNLPSRGQGTRVCIYSDWGAKRGLGGDF